MKNNMGSPWMKNDGGARQLGTDDDIERAAVAMTTIRAAIASYREVLEKVENAVSTPGRIAAFAMLSSVMEGTNASILKCDLDALRRIAGDETVESLMEALERQSRSISELMRLHGYAGAIH